MAKRLNGRGIGPSKVAPAPMEEEVTFEAGDLDKLKAPETDEAALKSQFPFLTKEMETPIPSILGDLEGATEVKIAVQGGEPIALRITGTSMDTGKEFTHVYPEKSSLFQMGGAEEERLTLKQIEQMPKETTFARMQSRWDTPPDTRPAWKRPFTSRPQPHEVEERVALGRFVGTKTEGTNYNGVFIIKFERPDGRPMEVRYEGTDAPPVTDIFVDTRGGRRSRLQKQAGRTKRNRRNLKRKQLRKLSTRRR